MTFSASSSDSFFTWPSSSTLMRSAWMPRSSVALARTWAASASARPKHVATHDLGLLTGLVEDPVGFASRLAELRLVVGEQLLGLGLRGLRAASRSPSIFAVRASRPS